MKKKILIISTGILSAYLSKFLVSKGHKVYVTSRSVKKKYFNFKELKVKKKITFKKLNVLNKRSIDKLLDDIKPSVIFYFAGQSSIVKSIKHSKATLESNFIGCENFLKILKKKGLKTKFLKANSGYIFSSKKNFSLQKPKFSKNNNPYISAQKKAFQSVLKFRKQGVNCYSIIFYNVESRLRPNDFFIKKVCNYLKKNIYKKDTLSIGRLDLVRDFGWASELVKGAYYMSYLKPCDLVIASGKKFSLRKILEFAFKIKNINYKNFIKVEKRFIRKNEQKNIFFNLDFTLKKLSSFGWKPKIYGKKLVNKIYNSL